MALAFGRPALWRPRSLLALIGLALAVALCWWPQFNAVADEAVDAGFKRALVSFATARTLHGVIAVVQGTELAVQPMGMGVTLTPGQMLAPINDLAAQVADWMLWASVAFGLQKLLLAMGGSLWVSGAVTLLALLWLAARLRGHSPPWLTRLLVVLLFARLVMPVTILGSEQLFAHFLAQPYEQSQLASDAAAHALQAQQPSGAESPAPDAQGPGLLERLKQWGSGARDAVASPVQTAQAQLQRISAALDQLVQQLVTLIVVFALQTIVLPLLLAWALLQLFRGLLQATSGAIASAQS
ncbi:MAG: hypothetical protein LC123_10520 [Burkholderiales bacterium]|uniref:hypothetical protein n=1 Tax=Comamonas sp. NLF-1-9 TaxID=2853163 RepID=UPI001C47DADF|nr:hypothetical protein [Comamonas sp. NLF-1-9]MCZ2420261.1 hypothetical protein [Burkholderiales bacterium]QXL83209.1 hypothetical protein KUD94_07960 [Comamonas sp. NLF-1-9]